MSIPGADDLIVQARSTLLDALEALASHRESVVVIGAQAVYLHTGAAEVALAEATKDSDIALDTRSLGGDPRIEEAMEKAGFLLNPTTRQPGSWVNARGVPVDLMVPELLAGPSGRRGARIPPHDRRAMRRAVGLEAAVIDHAETEIRSLSPHDERFFTANVAGPAALMVAKLHKIGDRVGDASRSNDKDAHDVYRLLVAVRTEVLADSIMMLRSHPLSAGVTNEAMDLLRRLFAQGPSALGSHMAGRAERGIGDPDIVAASSSVLADDLCRVVDDRP
jgi:hypothetical protein